MIRLHLFAEGQTEAAFAELLLKEHLAALDVFLHPPCLVAHGRRHGRTQRGGGSSYQAMRNDIARRMRQESGPEVRFTTMIDLYAISTDFPGLAEARRIDDPRGKVALLEAAFGADLGDERFVPYIQLHEFEAYLFCDPAAFRTRYDDCERSIHALQSIVDQHESPELIDDGPETAPSKRIATHFPRYAKVKSSDGPILAQTIGLTTIRRSCPHFNDWVARLESFANSSQPRLPHP